MINGVHVGFGDGYIVGPATVHDSGNHPGARLSFGELRIKGTFGFHRDTVKSKNRVARQEAGVCCGTTLCQLDDLNAVCAVNGFDDSQCSGQRYSFRGCFSWLACQVAWSRMI